MRLDLRRSKHGVRLRLDGRAEPGGAARLRDMLLTPLADGEAVVVDVSRVEEIDLASLQVLFAAAKSMGERGLAFRVIDAGGQALDATCVALGVVEGALDVPAHGRDEDWR